MAKIAVIQESPVLLDRSKTIEKAIQFIDKVAAADAELVVFPEAYISGYPAWIWRLRPGGDWGLRDLQINKVPARQGQSPRPISASPLNAATDLHTRPTHLWAQRHAWHRCLQRDAPEEKFRSTSCSPPTLRLYQWW